ncbi:MULTISPECIES: LysR family transcriptional regulator [Pandoraea]|uniref:LysR family transcriptional regulator n=1 Tax=Pandoraea cepalis TaxID=2508294 RepID=A0A5E4TS84_9BURK|nr:MULTISPECIES: LysR substrate-binding domain-containing protein [Pandoraea]QBC32742.1 LysR family transcriptional regulator [Pandoraea sp. XY-2]VVD89464.1 LysR family transcriptional regulator [Pandoraea cepalis]
MIELRHFQYFVVLAETLHFGRAAQQLHISQPPLSRQIALMEAELGVQLFERTRRSVRLTRAGARLYQDAVEILNSVDRARRNVVAASRGEDGAITVGFMMSSAYNILPALTRTYAAAYSRVDMKLAETLPNLLAESVRAGQTDVGIMYRPEDLTGLGTATVFREEMVAVLPRTHPLGKARVLDAAQLAEESFVSIPREIAPLVYDLVVDHCRRAGFSPHIRLETNLQQTIINLVGEGLGVAMVPMSMSSTSAFGNAVFRPLRNAPVAEVALLWSRDNHNPCVETFVENARAVWRDMQRAPGARLVPDGPDTSAR